MSKEETSGEIPLSEEVVESAVNATEDPELGSAPVTTIQESKVNTGPATIIQEPEPVVTSADSVALASTNEANLGEPNIPNDIETGTSVEKVTEKDDFIPERTIVDKSFASNKALTGAKSIAKLIPRARDAGIQYAMNEMDRASANIGDIHASRFQKWKKSELIDLLISQDVELREEPYIPFSVLRDLCDELYKDKPMPLVIPAYTEEEYKKANAAAYLVQNRWIEKQAIQRWQRLHEEQLSEEYIMSMGYGDSSSGRGAAEMSLLEEEEPATPSPPPAEGAGDIEMGTTADKEDAPLVASKPARPKEEPFVMPSLDIAMAYADKHHPRMGTGKHITRFVTNETTTGRHCCVGGLGEQCDIFAEGQVSQFSQFGPGITNYFKYLKWNIGMFLVLSLLSLVPFIFNYWGPNNSDTSLSLLAKTTAASIATTVNTTVAATITVPGCHGYNYNDIDCTITPFELSRMYGYTDSILVVCVMFGYVWLRHFERIEEANLDKNSITAAEFSVRVDGLPRGSTEAELKAHMAKITRKAVASIQFAYNNSAEITAYKKRGKLVQERYHVIMEKKYLEHRMNIKHEYITDAKSKIANLDMKKKTLGMKIKGVESDLFSAEDDQSHPLCAFVTFDEKIGVVSAKSAYTMSVFGRLCMPRALRFKGARISVSDAPEPSTIIWENLNYTKWMRARRRMMTGFIAFLLIFISLVAQFSAQMVQNSAAASAGNALCPENFTSLTQEEQLALVDDNDQLLHCYCDQLNPTTQNNDEYCSAYFIKKFRALLIIYGASFVVLMMNGLLDVAVDFFADFEKHHSIDLKSKSIFTRLFWSYVLNTGLVFVIEINPSRFGFINALTGAPPTPLVKNFTSGWFESVGVAIALVQLGNVLAGRLWPLYQYYSHKKNIKRAAANPKYALTQEELNAVALGPPFRIANAYAIQSAVGFVCLIFCTGIPILPMFGLANFFIAYFADKFFFINLYRTPPRYNTELNKSATRLIPVALWLHIIFAIWTLSNDEIFQSNITPNELTNAGSKGLSRTGELKWLATYLWDICTLDSTLPLFILLIILSLSLIAEAVVEATYGSVGQVVLSIFGNVCSQWHYMSQMKAYYVQKGQKQLTYSRAVQRGLIKGLASYNILQNPFYMEAFAISSNFASQHHTMKSMRFATGGAAKKRLLQKEAEEKSKKSALKKAEMAQKAKMAARPPRELTHMSSSVARDALLL